MDYVTYKINTTINCSVNHTYHGIRNHPEYYNTHIRIRYHKYNNDNIIWKIKQMQYHIQGISNNKKHNMLY